MHKSSETSRVSQGICEPNSRAVALLEVILAFVAVHLAFRAIKGFTPLGRLEAEARWNYTPGLTMLLFTIGNLWLLRRDFAVHGLTLRGWSYGLKLGLIWGMVLVSGAALLIPLGVRHHPGAIPPGIKEGGAYGLACLTGIIVFIWLLKRSPVLLERVPSWLCLTVVAGLLSFPLDLALINRRPFLDTFFTVAWLVIGAGVGEEFFYRGYIQSRINAAFGRPFRIGNLQFGAGLLVSSVLFGFLHALNSVDYFHGHFTFAWGFGAAALGTGLLFGCLREATGSVVAGIVTHSILDVLARVPSLMS